jgi:uncharacterized protein (DUF433 family)
MRPTNEYVEIRNGGYYVSGTRIGLDVVVYDLRDGDSAEEIFEAHPSIGSLAKTQGAVAFIQEHPEAVEAYLKDQDRRFEEIKAEYPWPQDMLDRYNRAKIKTSASFDGSPVTTPGPEEALQDIPTR